MELWIRSQDRLSLLKPFDLELMPCLKTPDSDYDTTDFRAYLSKSEDDYVILGTYKTKERALEVLDEIQRLITPTFKINYEYDDSQPIIDGEWLKSLKAESKIEELSCYVYEMPKE